MGTWWIYRLPLWKDWLFWWTLLIAFAAVSATSNEYSTDPNPQPVALIVDGGLRLAFYLLIAVGIPAWIRKN